MPLTGGCREHLQQGCCSTSTVVSVTADHEQPKEWTVAGASKDVDSTRKRGSYGFLVWTGFAVESVPDMDM